MGAVLFSLAEAGTPVKIFASRGDDIRSRWRPLVGVDDRSRMQDQLFIIPPFGFLRQEIVQLVQRFGIKVA
jgi:hypothetical protein